MSYQVEMNAFSRKAYHIHYMAVLVSSIRRIVQSGIDKNRALIAE